jgi:hypothetical protein
MQMDQALDVGLNPPEFIEYELHGELWDITSLALRNWLKNAAAPPAHEDAEERAACACFASENICSALGYLRGKAKRVYTRLFPS